MNLDGIIILCILFLCVEQSHLQNTIHESFKISLNILRILRRIEAQSKDSVYYIVYFQYISVHTDRRRVLIKFRPHGVSF